MIMIGPKAHILKIKPIEKTSPTDFVKSERPIGPKAGPRSPPPAAREPPAGRERPLGRYQRLPIKGLVEGLDC